MSEEGAARAKQANSAVEPVSDECFHSVSLRTRSRTGFSSQSGASSTGSAAAKARAKAEAAKACLAYAEEEMNLKLEKARLEASLEVLKQKRETAAAIAEAEALEAAIDVSDSLTDSFSSDMNDIPVPLLASQRTQQYVTDQLGERVPELQLNSNSGTMMSSAPLPSPLKADAKPFISQQNSLTSPILTCQQPCWGVGGDDRKPITKTCGEVYTPHVKIKDEHAIPMHQSTPGQYDEYSSRNPIPSDHNDNGSRPSQYPISPHSNESSLMNDFVRYLARRELVATGLLQFNDKPQTYRAWRRSFQTATRDLNLTPSEELDLLLKWLGKESAEQVKIRANR